MQTLRDILRLTNGRNIVVVGPGRAHYIILGFGPNQKVVGWKEDSKNIKELDPDKRIYHKLTEI